MPTFVQILFLISIPLVFSLPIQNNEWISYFNWEHLGPGTYCFGYEIEDPKTGNVQFRHEEKHPNGTVTGKYGLVEPDGNVKIVHYISDQLGYRVKIEDSLTGKVTNWPPSEPSGGYSPEYNAALGASNTIGQNVQEQHTPNKYTDYYGNYYNNQLYHYNQYY